MSVYTDRLKKMQGEMEEQMTDYVPGGFTLLAEGEYQARMEAKLDILKGKSGAADRLMVVWKYTVAEGDKMGKNVIEKNILEGGKDNGKTAKQICRGHVEDLGHAWPDKMVGLEAVLLEISQAPPLVEIRVTHEDSTDKDGKKYTNARVRLLDVLEGGAMVPDDSNTASADTGADNDVQEDPNLAPLLALCGSYQLTYIDDSMDVNTIVENLHANEATFKEEDLQPEELEVLEAVDASFIERKKVTPPARRMATPPPKAAAVKGKR